jgi:hypothetical protein
MTSSQVVLTNEVIMSRAAAAPHQLVDSHAVIAVAVLLLYHTHQCWAAIFQVGRWLRMHGIPWVWQPTMLVAGVERPGSCSKAATAWHAKA